MVGRGEKRLLWDPGSDMRLGRVEKRRVKIINGMEKKYSFFERFCLDRLRALHRCFFDPYFAGDARENRERQATSSQARSKIIDSIFDNVSTFMVSGHTRRTFQDSILKHHTGRNVSVLLFCAVVNGLMEHVSRISGVYLSKPAWRVEVQCRKLIQFG